MALGRLAGRPGSGSTDLSGLFASVDSGATDLLGPDLQNALAEVVEVEEAAAAAAKPPSAKSLRRAVVAAIRTVEAAHLAPCVVSFDEAAGLYHAAADMYELRRGKDDKKVVSWRAKARELGV